MWGHDYKINYIKDPHLYGESVLGLFKATDQEIVLSKRLKENSRIAEVLLHEIFHGICYNGSTFVMVDVKDKRELEEHVVDTMANGLVLVLKDNKELYDYLGYLLYENDTTKKTQPE